MLSINANFLQILISGGFSEYMWKDSNRFHGSRGNFIFVLQPSLNVYRTTGRDNAFQWLNTSSYGLMHGIGFGGSRESFRFFIPDSFDECIATGSDLSYDPGPFLPRNEGGKFEIETMEIWGTGGIEVIENALINRTLKREAMDATLQQARKIDKAQFANSSFDQEFLLSKTFSHKTKDRGNDS